MSIGGRVHSNANVYVDPSAEVSFASTLTASGDIYNYHESGYALGGTVLIKDATGTDQAMAGLDSDSPDWASESITRWGGRVRSGETGGDRVELVIDPLQSMATVSLNDQELEPWLMANPSEPSTTTDVKALVRFDVSSSLQDRNQLSIELDLSNHPGASQIVRDVWLEIFAADR